LASLAVPRMSFTRLARRLGARHLMLGALGLTFVGAAAIAPTPPLALAALLPGLSLIWLALILRGAVWWRAWRNRRLERAVRRIVEHDATPAFITDPDGMIAYQNAAAIRAFGGAGGGPLLDTLRGHLAAPSSTLFRLQARALAGGAAREDVFTRAGQVRLSAHRAGPGTCLWRLDRFEAAPEAGDAAAAMGMPMLRASPGGRVLWMNPAMQRLAGGLCETLGELMPDTPLQSGEMHQVNAVEGPIRARVFEMKDNLGRREIYILPESDAPLAEWDLLDSLPVPLLKIGADATVLLANRPARALLGQTLPQGRKLSDLVEGLGRPVNDWVMEAAEGRTVLKPEIARATGTEHELYLQITLNRIADGGETALIGVLSDATELKTLEAQFVQSQKMQAIGQLAGGVAHDFNNLLTAISGHCDLLLLRHDESDPEYGDLVQIHQNANRAASLVGQLLAFSRKQTLKPEIVDMRDALSDLAHLLNRLVGEKVSLRLEHEDGLRPIRADKRQIEQVIMNLVVNARDAMQEGGEIVIRTRMERLAAPLERDRAKVPPGDYVVVSVTDEGAGIPPDKLPKVFEPFYTTKRTGEGTGLGLSTAYGIVKQTGGFIFADSTWGEGSTFTMYLPAHSNVEGAQPAAAEAGGPIKLRQHSSGVVLLVEDEAPVRAFASRALRMRGYTVIEAESAEEALELLKDETLEVNVFVTDVIMPGMDGPTWVSEALKTRPDVKVVFVSGYAEENFTEQQSRIPGSVFLPKPFSLSELAATVQLVH